MVLSTAHSNRDKPSTCTVCAWGVHSEALCMQVKNCGTSTDIALGMSLRKPTSFGSLAAIVSVTYLFPLFLICMSWSCRVLRCRRFCPSCHLKWRVQDFPAYDAHEETGCGTQKRCRYSTFWDVGFLHRSRRNVDILDNLDVRAWLWGH